MADRRSRQSSREKPRLRRVAGSQRRKAARSDAPRQHWVLRLRTWIIGVLVAGLALGITDLVSRTVGTGANKVEHLISGSDLVQDQSVTSDGLTIRTMVLQGLGCPPKNGDVYPRSVTPGLSPAVEPGAGPTHGGKTWANSPGMFGAVPASPTQIQIFLTGPTNHAVIITDLKFHVISRKPQIKGTWLNLSSGCGAGGNYHYGAVDFDTQPPYWISTRALPERYRTDALKFPYTVTANDPESLVIDVQMENCDCTWDATLSWIDGSTAKSKVLDDNGHPFETTSVTGVTGADWHDTSNDSTPRWSSIPLPQ